MAEENKAAQTKFMPGTKADNSGFPENFVNRIFIDTKPVLDDAGDVDLNDVTTGSWAWVASGINTQTPSANETTTNDAYYDGGGFTETDVTGKQIQLAVSGNRKVGDPAQDYVDKLFFKFGSAVKTRVIWIKNNLPIIAQCTISNIVPTGGQSNQKQTFSFNIDFNGRPKIFNGQLTMTATSTAKIYSASVDSTKKAANDDDLVPAVVVEEVAASNQVKVTGFTVDNTDVTGNVGDEPKVVVNEIVPDNATDKKLIATSADVTISTANFEADGLTLDLNLLKAGKTKVTVASEDGGFSQDINVTVNA